MCATTWMNHENILLSEVSQSQILCGFTYSQVVRFVETESGMLVAGAGGGEGTVMLYGFRASGLQDEDSFGGGWWWWLHNNGNVPMLLNCTVKKGSSFYVIYIFCVFCMFYVTCILLRLKQKFFLMSKNPTTYLGEVPCWTSSSILGSPDHPEVGFVNRGLSFPIC